MERITVTATRSNTDLLAVTSNLSTIDHDAIKLVEHEHINQIMVRVPGGWISRGNGQEHLTAIRSPVLTGAGGCGAFFIAQDGISLRAPGFCNANQLMDANTEQAERIEVLSGPASTLYGTNAVHGVINVLTPDPLTENYSDLGLVVGPHQYYRADGSFTSQYENHGFMLYGNIASDGGYKDDSGFEQQKLNFIHQYQADKTTIKSVMAYTNLAQETAGYIEGEEAYKDEDLKRSNPNPEAFRNNQSFRAYSRIQYAIDDDTFASITPYFRWADTEFLQHYLPWKSLEENDQMSVGFQSQLEKSFNNINVLLGFDTDLTRGGLQETQDEPFSPSIPQGEHYNYTVDATIYAPFVEATWFATEKLHINAGLRFEDTTYDYHNKLSDGSACAAHIENCRFSRPASQKVNYQEVSNQVGFNYRITTQNTVYGQFSNGYRAPQATELFRLQDGQVIADLDTENIESIELGIRGNTLNLFYDMNVFSMDKDNFIFQDTNRQNISDGETSHQGIEFSLNYQLPKNFYANVNGTFAEHKYQSSVSLSNTDIKGNYIDTAPETMGSMQLGWRDEQNNQLEVEWVHLGEYFVDPENTAKYSGHNLLNLRARFNVNNQLSVSARLLNVTNADYAERADYSFGNYRYFVGEPRSLFISMRYMFN
ncbi:TonB-dependent receptor [Colwellia sp. E2M01]|nr:TonB-dependent receptor [Colwellia sp. E2M01]